MWPLFYNAELGDDVTNVFCCPSTSLGAPPCLTLTLRSFLLCIFLLSSLSGVRQTCQKQLFPDKQIDTTYIPPPPIRIIYFSLNKWIFYSLPEVVEIWPYTAISPVVLLLRCPWHLYLQFLRTPLLKHILRFFFFLKKKVATEIITSFIFVARAESHTRKESDVLPLPTGTNFL